MRIVIVLGLSLNSFITSNMSNTLLMEVHSQQTQFTWEIAHDKV